MRPRTKRQKEVAELSRHLSEITDTQKEWAKKHCFPHIAKRTTKGECICLECGHRWSDKHNHSKKVTCPHCSSILEVTTTRQRVFQAVRILHYLDHLQRLPSGATSLPPSELHPRLSCGVHDNRGSSTLAFSRG